MALLDFFKKAEKGQPRMARKPDVAVREKKEEASGKVVLKESNIAWRILRQPHVTEKATEASRLNQYIFRVYDRTSKSEVKRAIQEVYGVHVLTVRKIHIPRKQRRHGRHIWWKSGYTKAVIELQKGEKIEVLPH
ncbi:MAG: 50S ribosomal protein L23 [Candidatus Spechtbacteria bacterium]|nr:50S ribosomal protein L23 [Candidatus Spechtbacteria bacterium]